MTAPRVLVTGATGFIGSHVVRRLVHDGATVVGLASAPPAGVPARLADVAADVEVLGADVRDSGTLGAAVKAARPDLVVHLAALSHVGASFLRTDDHIAVNVQGTVNLLRALDGDFARMVHVGSGDVYGGGPVPFREDQPVEPVSPYAVSKYAAERFCRMSQQAWGWPIVCLRPFNAYGPAQGVDRIVPELVAAGLRRRPLRMTEGRQTREFTYVEDLADACVRALTAPGVEGAVLNVGRGEEVSMRDLAGTVLDLLGRPVEPEFGALPYRPTEIWRMVGDSSRARQLLGWAPRFTLEDGLRATIDWYRAHLDA